MSFAVIETGGKQYKVSAGDKIKIEKLEGGVGDNITFDRVLLSSDGANVNIGTPTISGGKVEGRILRQARTRKVIVFRFHRKTRYQKKNTHRQNFTEVEITKI